MEGAKRLGMPHLGEGVKKVENSLIEIDAALNGLLSALVAASEDFVSMCRKERSVLRQRLLKEGGGESVRTSFVFLSLVKKQTTVEFRWSEARSYWNDGGRWVGDSGSRRLGVTKSGFPRRSDLLRDAHPEEVPMLLRHAEHVAALKESWGRLHKLSAAERAFRNQFVRADRP